MAIPKFEADLNIISQLPDRPNDERGLSPQAFKEEFDRAGLLVKEYINEILVPQANIDIDNASKGIGGSGVDGSSLTNGSVTAPKLAANSVTTDKVANDAITADKIAPKAVTEEAVADFSVGERAYKQGSIKSAALAQGSVTEDKIYEGAVTAAKLAPAAVTIEKVADIVRTQYNILEVSTNWEGGAAPFTQVISASDILSTDLPKAYFWSPENFENLDAQQEAFSMLCGIESADGKITLKAKEIPDVAFSVLVEAIRI